MHDMYDIVSSVFENTSESFCTIEEDIVLYDEILIF